MVKQIIIIVTFLFSAKSLIAQVQVDPTGASIQKIANSIQENDTLEIRLKLDSVLTNMLWTTLSTPNAFQFSFDSLQFISKVISPDAKIKLFTWQIALSNEHYLQKGILQYKGEDGNIQLFQLKDINDEVENTHNIEGTNYNWVGAVYFDILQNEFEGNPYYTLLGFDAFDHKLTKKIIEVLHFENGQPIFGGDFFEYPPDDTYPEAPVKRFILTYKKGSNALVRYENQAKAIIISELASIENNLKEKSTLVPTGDEVYFIWKNGKWRMPK